jgi:hypothetical protein
VLAAVTRLRLRSWRFLIPFALEASRSQKQAINSPGCLGVVTRKTRGWAFWTLSLWEDEARLRAFLVGNPHRGAMPKLFPWCDEAATLHWPVESRSLPGWEEATLQLLQSGRLLRVRFPSPEQSKGVINVS